MEQGIHLLQDPEGSLHSCNTHCYTCDSGVYTLPIYMYVYIFEYPYMYVHVVNQEKILYEFLLLYFCTSLAKYYCTTQHLAQKQHKLLLHLSQEATMHKITISPTPPSYSQLSLRRREKLNFRDRKTNPEP